MIVRCLMCALALYPSIVAAQTATTQPAESPREVMREFVTWTVQVQQALQSAKDVPSAEAAAGKLDASIESGRKLFDRSAKMLSQVNNPAEVQSIQKEFQADIEKNMSQIFAERQRIASNPALDAILTAKINTAIASVSRAATTAPASSQPAAGR
jgi:hypothetical protein